MTKREREEAVAACLDQIKAICGPSAVLLIVIPDGVAEDVMMMSNADDRRDFIPYLINEAHSTGVFRVESRGVTKQ